MGGYPQLVLGTMLFGSLVSERQAFQMLDCYFDHGYTHLDTAPVYPSPCQPDTFGLTEQILGRYFAARPNTYILSARVSTKFSNSSSKLPYARKQSGPISYSELCFSFAQSQARLYFCHIDAYFVHWPDRAVNNFGKIIFVPRTDMSSTLLSNLDISLSALMRFASDTGVSTVGISNETPLGLERLLSASFASSCKAKLAIQNPYNLLTPYYDIALSELCFHNGISLYAHSPLAFGTLVDSVPIVKRKEGRHALYPDYFSRYNVTTSALLDCLRDLSRSLGLTLEELAIRYVISNPTVTHILIGPRTPRQLLASISAFRKGPLCKSTIHMIHSIYASTPGFSF